VDPSREASGRRWPLPPLFLDWPWAIRIVLAGIVPMGFGFLCGALLDSSAALFLGLQVVAAVGGFLAGLEHEHPRHALVRGMCAGLLFGGFILIGHHVIGGDDHDLIPDPELLQLAITATLGVVLGILGARTRRRLESSDGRSPPT
jgi:hypothetical protein